VAKEDLTLVRVLRLGDRGKDVVAIKRMIARAGVGFTPVKEKGKIGDLFGEKLEAAVRSFQKKNNLIEDGEVAYMTFKALLKHVGPWESKLLRDVAKERLGDWGILARKSAWAGLDMGVDFTGGGPIRCSTTAWSCGSCTQAPGGRGSAA
jgi:peptidoglycan hydrolase-like protein with peptidoglycan-binding domain